MLVKVQEYSQIRDEMLSNLEGRNIPEPYLAICKLIIEQEAHKLAEVWKAIGAIQEEMDYETD